MNESRRNFFKLSAAACLPMSLEASAEAAEAPVEGLTSEEMAKLVFERDGDIGFYGEHYGFGTVYRLTGDPVDIRDFDKFPTGSNAGFGPRAGKPKWHRCTKIFEDRYESWRKHAAGGPYLNGMGPAIDGYDLDEPGLNLIIFHDHCESYVRTGTKTHPWRKV